MPDCCLRTRPSADVRLAKKAAVSLLIQAPDAPSTDCRCSAVLLPFQFTGSVAACCTLTDFLALVILTFCALASGCCCRRTFYTLQRPRAAHTTGRLFVGCLVKRAGGGTDAHTTQNTRAAYVTRCYLWTPAPLRHAAWLYFSYVWNLPTTGIPPARCNYLCGRFFPNTYRHYLRCSWFAGEPRTYTTCAARIITAPAFIYYTFQAFILLPGPFHGVLLRPLQLLYWCPQRKPHYACYSLRNNTYVAATSWYANTLLNVAATLTRQRHARVVEDV